MEALLNFTLEHYFIFLVAGGLGTLFFSYVTGSFFINVGVSNSIRGVIYGLVTSLISLIYEYYNGMRDLFQFELASVIVIFLWVSMTIILGVVSVNCWRIVRPFRA